jgi:hypothetical protein
MLNVFILLSLWSAANCWTDIPLTPNKTYTSNISLVSREETSLTFSFDPNYTPRLTTILYPDHFAESVGFLVTDACIASSFSLPSPSSSSDSSPVVASRPICQQSCPQSNGIFGIGVTSFANHTVGIKIELEDISVTLDNPRSTTVRYRAPIYFRYDFANSPSRVLFQVRSSSHTEAIVSIQNKSCPVFDAPDNVEYQVRLHSDFTLVLTIQGRRQTMTTQADIFAEQSEHNENGLYIVVVLLEEDCMLEKDITITPVAMLPLDEYAGKVFFMLSWFFMPIVIFFVLLSFETCRRRGFALFEPHTEEAKVDLVEKDEEDEVEITHATTPPT